MGDKVKTSICGQRDIWKDSPRIEAIGAVDELNSFIGYSRSISDIPIITKTLEEIQKQLFILGADLATPLNSELKAKRIGKSHTQWVEEMAEEIGDMLPRLRKFILPGGTQLAASLQVARTVCRRAERRIVALSRVEPVNEEAIRYINRLSTLLYLLSRLANIKKGVNELQV